MDELIEKLRSVKWDVIAEGDRMPDDPTRECVFVDMRPDDFEALLNEAAAALEAAREDAERYRWLRERWGRIAETYEDDHMVFIGDGDAGEGWDTAPDSIDAAIDAAIAR